ncbi:FAD/NAD(P)-binding domain-containing protein [Rhizoclosmatium globosum]|uniref:FAD/NAD(P)-binding domain-containing protein n=1 Tax=Rhizoclosmatium globosum TaxID=329046 RepID=A0A1Y2CEW6_9FUNG|nr:FAD/NAD(P)-binding domain-containing protein [Rhizoclosmatium globosum]|eukprot:ORY45476.1 FAD/NAD(P)-binding domain-containing protein [Rhizoclosmatium globosum]
MRAIVVGAGLIGASTALALKQVGIHPTLYEQEQSINKVTGLESLSTPVEFEETGGAVILSTNALRLIRSLGLLEEVMTQSSVCPSTTYFKINGSGAISKATSKLVSKSDATLSVPRQILYSKWRSILLQACQRSGIRCFTGKKLHAVNETKRGIIAFFHDGSTTTGDFLVGADGMHSATRQSIFGVDSVAGFTGVLEYTGVVKLKEIGITVQEDRACYVDRDRKRLVWVHKPSEDFGVIQIVHGGDNPRSSEDEQFPTVLNVDKESKRLGDMVSGWGVPKHVETLIRNAFRISFGPVYDLPNLEVYHKRNVALLGDAAHGTAPYSALNLETGLEGVGILQELFSQLQGIEDAQQVFELYSRIHLPKGHLASKQSRDFVMQLYSKSTIGYIWKRLSNYLPDFKYVEMNAGNQFDFVSEVTAAIGEFKETQRP